MADNMFKLNTDQMIILGDGGYCSMGYITLNKMAHQLLPFAFYSNVLIALADPGFDQGGAPEIFSQDFANVVKWSQASEVSQY